MGGESCPCTSAFCAISSRKRAERSCLALGITTSTSIRSRHGERHELRLVVVLAVLRVGAREGDADEAREELVQHEVVVGLRRFFDPGVGKSGAKRSGSSANAPFFTARGFENSASFDSFSASAWTAELRRSRWRCSKASAVFVAFAFANMLVRVAKLTSFVEVRREGRG